ncbi:hypothetical protein M5K25_010113 [Dendrobium thyrsiflorum]|uniref:ADF-H domain-containing protein n=1 Tax=Dendrobium thyrsiflorum TaxID=117978 RepID=A0ABD0UZ66_DENTH
MPPNPGLQLPKPRDSFQLQVVPQRGIHGSGRQNIQETHRRGPHSTRATATSLSLSLSLYPRTKVSSIHQFRKALSSRCDGNPRFSLLFSADQAAKMANSASGMAVNDDCKLKFLELKAKRTYRFIIYKIDEKLKQVVVDKVGEPTLNYDDFTANLSGSECRYAVYDFDFFTEENVPKSKIFFIAWSPDTSKVRNKMLYASTKESFKRELDGIQVELQATDPSEIHLDVIKGRAN